jgi:hypothetical protein
MGRIQYPYNVSVEGPWLLSASDLIALDSVIQRINELLLAGWREEMATKVVESGEEVNAEEIDLRISKHEEKSWTRTTHLMTCSLISNAGVKIEDDTFSQLLRVREIKDFSPVSLTVRIKHSGISPSNDFSLKISDTNYKSLSYEIESLDNDRRDEIQYEIDKWVEERTPNNFLRLWANRADFFAFILWVPLLVLLYLSFSSSNTTYMEVLTHEAHALIDSGIDSSNIDVAVDLFTQAIFNYTPDDFVPSPKAKNPIYLKSFFVILFVWVASVFRPKTIVGVGRKEQNLKAYNFWIKLVTITLPFALIVAPFWSVITSWLYGV